MFVLLSAPELRICSSLFTLITQSVCRFRELFALARRDVFSWDRAAGVYMQILSSSAPWLHRTELLGMQPYSTFMMVMFKTRVRVRCRLRRTALSSRWFWHDVPTLFCSGNGPRTRCAI